MKDKKHNWIVTVRCEVTKSVVTEPCTEDEARNNLWAVAEDETERGMSDWEVIKIERNE